VRLTVLGRWSPYPPPGGACPGYLVQSGDIWILLDCGSGVVAALHRCCGAHQLRAAVLTHLHPDHFSDVYALQNALRFGRYPEPPAPPLPLYAPRGAGETLAAALPTESARVEFRDRFVFHPLDAGEAEVNGAQLRFVRTTHPVPCHAVEVSAGGRRLVYTADTGPSAEVDRLAAGADVLLAECSLVEGAAHLATAWGHLTGGMAGAMAARAGVGRLLLTHFFTPHHAVQESVAAAAKEFRAVFPVDEGSTYEV